MRKILVTNDDGINSQGLKRLVTAAAELGEVWVVAPETERSAASHSITLRSHIDVYPYDYPVRGVKAYSCSGTPADCVRVGGLAVMEEPPDAVLSGINFGYNVATDLQYSATAGAAFEGAFQGWLSIALSEGTDGDHAATDEYLPRILKELLLNPIPAGHIWNVNFPDGRCGRCKGILYDRTVSDGMVFKDRYNRISALNGGGIRYEVEGIPQSCAKDGTDLKAVTDGYVSVGIVNNVGV